MMETLKKRLSFPGIQFLKAFILLGLIAGLTGCPDGGGGGGNPPAVTPLDPYGGYCGSCTTSITNPVTLSVFESSTANGNVAFTNMELIGDASYVMPNASGKNFRNYQGPIALRGTMVVNTNTQDAWSPCMLPAGTYSVQTYEVGSMGFAGGDINVPRLTTTSGSVEIVVANGILTEMPARMTGFVGVMSVAGMACSQNFMDMFF